MKTKPLFRTLPLTLALGVLSASAAKTPPAPPAPLSENAKQLESVYAGQLQALKQEILAALPEIPDARKAAYLQARDGEIAAKAALEEAQNRMGEIARAQGLVSHAKGKWIGGAEKGIADAKAKLASAKTDAERKAAQDQLANWEKNKAEGEAALRERQAALDAAEKQRPEFERGLKAAEEGLAQAKARMAQAVQGLGMDRILGSDQLDGRLARYVFLKEATPKGLALYAEKGAAHQALIDQALADDRLLVAMAVADGANGGQYPRALEILRDIQQASDKANSGPLQRLALAVALEHAVPIQQRNAADAVNAPEVVDPVKRYLHYEKAFLNQELDPAFKDLTVWDYRMVVDGEEPDEILTWGREMLRNYRPDQITSSDNRWRYVELVRSDIRYGSQDNQFDEGRLHFFQNILKNGGVCGRRAFMGRFILRAFGMPTTARPQRGHAALVRWTPDGWVPCLGAGWGSGWTKTRYDRDLDFLANTQARATGAPFLQVKRAQWIGDVMGEPQVFGFLSKKAPEFWYGVSLYTQRGIIEAAQAKTLAAVGEDIGEANETKEVIEIAKVTITDEERQIRVGRDGVITIPAAATSNPTKSTGKIIFMDSVLGGKQLHYSRNGGPQDFEYTFDAPAAGKYALTAKLVTPSWQQNLLVSANGGEQVQIALPFTVGMWDTTEPVQVELKQGRNLLKFSHKSDGQAKGFSIREFKLTPVPDKLSQRGVKSV